MAALGEDTIAADEAALNARFVEFLKTATLKRDPTGVRRRFNQGRASGCVDAEFIVPDTLPGDLRVGLWAAPATYRAIIRFASASSESDRERDTRGMAIKLFEVPGANETSGITEQDFILNSHPVMMVPGTREFLELLEANEAGGFGRAIYFLTHPRAARIAFASRANHTCHLDIPYWSTTPYRFGPDQAVKYIVRPLSPERSALPKPLTDDYLAAALIRRLAAADAEFEFLIQRQADAARTPIEDASVEWNEREAPYLPVARIRIPRQSVDRSDVTGRCERLSFNPWNCLSDHRPLGGMNRSRREIYRRLAEFRANR